MKPVYRIYITGASCAGVTTLGRRLAHQLAIQHLDVDDYYWMPTSPPFTTKRPPEERVSLIRQAQGAAGWVLTGSFDGWGDPLIDDVDLIVFVYTPTPVRLERLLAREKDRFGDRIMPGGDMHDIHIAFYQWASRYDDPEFSGRNRARHEAWLSDKTVPVLRLDGTHDVDDLATTVIAALTKKRNGPSASV
ncbi:MAG TPA: AAA family ATPase [Rhizobiaceae bacterium]|nr:AAA family ATPase [Rhizobiaceae bacterium]